MACLTPLDGVTACFSSFETTALLGHNGAGKTTLFKLIARLVKPRSGTVSCEGRIVILNEGAIVRSGTLDGDFESLRETYLRVTGETAS